MEICEAKLLNIMTGRKKECWKCWVASNNANVRNVLFMSISEPVAVVGLQGKTIRTRYPCIHLFSKVTRVDVKV